jgi:DNA-binding CsgD family transcriptional regulator
MSAAESEQGIARLSERERDTLRLLLQGHDAKSIAGALGISVHVVNERLRESRRKLGVTSSREAARCLASYEGGVPKYFGNEKIGLAARPGNVADGARPTHWATGPLRPLHLLVAGTIMTLILVSAAALWTVSTVERAAPSSGPPRVVATSPASGSVIPPGPFLLSVTFDRPMLAGNYSFVQTSAETYPQCELRPTLSRDARTYTLRCIALAGRDYEIWFNRPPYMNFKGLDRVPALPFQLLFRTGRR